MKNEIFTVRTVYGEIVGSLVDDAPVEDVETNGYLELANPLLVHIIAGPQGLINAMIPVTQTINTQQLMISAMHIVDMGPTDPNAAKKYKELISNIVLPPAPSIQLAR